METSSAPPPPVTITLTTWSKRIGVAHLALASLLRQRPAPDGIVLWLAADEIPESSRLPDALTKLVSLSHGRIRVRWFPTNIRSHKKLIPALLDPELRKHTLVTADDDILYPQGWLQELLEMHARHPTAVVAHRARSVLYPRPYNHWPLVKVQAKSSPGALLFPTTGGGVLYPPGSLHPHASDAHLAMRLTPTADDIFLWMHVLLNRTPIVLTQRPRWAIQCVDGTAAQGLAITNCVRGQNDVMLRAIIRHYAGHPAVAALFARGHVGGSPARPAPRPAARVVAAAASTAAPLRMPPSLRPATAMPARLGPRVAHGPLIARSASATPRNQQRHQRAAAAVMLLRMRMMR